MKNRVTAALLAIFLGSFGAHKFYLGMTGTGFLFLFMFFAFASLRFPITFILGIIEGFGLLNMSDEHFDRRYNQGRTRERPANPYMRGNQQNPMQQRNQPPANTGKARQPWTNMEPASYTRKNIFKDNGIKKYKEYDLEGAIEDFQKSLQMEPKDIASHFNIACAYSLTEQGEKAYFHLQKAVELGFNDFEKVNTHDDLAFVRIQPQWQGFKQSGYRSYEAFDRGLDGTAPESPQSDMLLDQLKKLDELRQKGLITDQEFAVEKRRLAN
jgi:TM2 domain-containing membrane protein YozV